MYGDDKNLAFMRSPDLWPHWPILPVKRPEDWAMGIMIEENPVFQKPPLIQPVVYLTSMFEFKYHERDKYEKVEFESLEDLVSAGWVVD